MTPFCAAVDWGTSNFRLWLLDESGQTLAERSSDEGMQKAIHTGFETILENHLAKLHVPPDLPVVICGMAGSRQGWKEAAYVDAPATLTELVNRAVRIHDTNRDVLIMPGICVRDEKKPDVMRGEETQLLGLKPGSGRSVVCMPGTHSKWVELQSDKVMGFDTYLTGELYDLLANQSILRLGLDPADSNFSNSPIFRSAVLSAFEEPALVSNRLFAIRAAGLLGYAPPISNGAELSGTLIGLELAGVRAQLGRLDHATLIASGPVADIYQSALDAVRTEVTLISSQKAVLSGLHEAAIQLFQFESERKSLGA